MNEITIQLDETNRLTVKTDCDNSHLYYVQHWQFGYGDAGDEWALRSAMCVHTEWTRDKSEHANHRNTYRQPPPAHHARD